MKIDSPRTSRTPELGGYRSSMSPTITRYIPSLAGNNEQQQQSPRVEETRRTKKITIQETSEQRLPQATKTSEQNKSFFFVFLIKQNFI